MPSKTVDVIVQAMDVELNFVIESSTTGRQLFDQVAKAIGLREIWFFGLHYTNNEGYFAWLKPDKKIIRQKVDKDGKLCFKLRAKFYPEKVEDEIIQDVTLRLFFLQVKGLILSGDIYCPSETSVLLASYAMQAKYGNFGNQQHADGFFGSERLLPSLIVHQHLQSNQEWENRITNWWRDFHGMDREQAMMEYLKVAQALDMYGISYFEIRNRNETELFLGVDALGCNVYEKRNKMNPSVSFPWSEVHTISYNNKKFSIKPVENKSKDFVFFVVDVAVNKLILSICMGNHELYERRRKPPCAKIQMMRQQVEEDRLLRQGNRQHADDASSARELAEKKQHEYEERVNQMHEEVDAAHQELAVAREKIRQLEEKLLELGNYNRELEQKERELEELTEQLYSERLMSEGERHCLTEKVVSQESQISEMRSQVDLKRDAAERLREEVESHRQSGHFKDNLENPIRTWPKHRTVHVSHDDHETNNIDDGAASFLRTSKQMPEQSSFTKDKLETLARELDAVKDVRRMSDFDRQHMGNRKSGRTKYSTLQYIRGGNTKRRIDQYENM